MTNNIDAFIEQIPKAELHLHIEGSLEPEMMLDLAKRNNVSLQYETVEHVKHAYNFNCLQDFLDIYFSGMSVLIHEIDFYELTRAYLEKINTQGVTHAEVFFDPQAHTARGIAFETVLNGITKALEFGRKEYGITSKLIMCFLRHLPESDAFETLALARKHKQHIFGVGLDSTENGYPPALFSNVFAEALKEGFVTVAHAGEEGTAQNVRDALDELGITRIDHGNSALNDPELVNQLAQEQIPLTMCPLSNLRLKVIPTMDQSPVKKALEAGLLVTINSDDPSYFGGYITDNYKAVHEALGLSKAEVIKLAQNSFKGSFLSDPEKQLNLDKIDAFINRFQGP